MLPNVRVGIYATTLCAAFMLPDIREPTQMKYCSAHSFTKQKYRNEGSKNNHTINKWNITWINCHIVLAILDDQFLCGFTFLEVSQFSKQFNKNKYITRGTTTLNEK
jgi:hypothetical protein